MYTISALEQILGKKGGAVSLAIFPQNLPQPRIVDTCCIDFVVLRPTVAATELAVVA